MNFDSWSSHVPIYGGALSAPPLDNKQKAILHKVYYDDKNFFGRDKIYGLVQDTGISRRQVQDWLSEQEAYQLYRVTRKAKTIQPTVLKQPRTQVSIDLIDMSTKAYDGHSWILTAIDMFSKKRWAVALKDKEATTVT